MGKTLISSNDTRSWTTSTKGHATKNVFLLKNFFGRPCSYGMSFMREGNRDAIHFDGLTHGFDKSNPEKVSYHLHHISSKCHEGLGGITLLRN